MGNDRASKIEQWWARLSGEERRRARELVEGGTADAWLMDSLQASDIWLVSSSWRAVPTSWTTHIPSDVAEFVEAQRR